MLVCLVLVISGNLKKIVTINYSSILLLFLFSLLFIKFLLFVFIFPINFFFINVFVVIFFYFVAVLPLLLFLYSATCLKKSFDNHIFFFIPTQQVIHLFLFFILLCVFYLLLVFFVITYNYHFCNIKYCVKKKKLKKKDLLMLKISHCIHLYVLLVQVHTLVVLHLKLLFKCFIVLFDIVNVCVHI